MPEKRELHISRETIELIKQMASETDCGVRNAAVATAVAGGQGE